MRSEAAMAITNPGKPAPEPRSIHAFASCAKSRSCNESATWRVQTRSSVAGPTRFFTRCQRRSSWTRRPNRSCVSRETGQSSSALMRSASTAPGSLTGARPFNEIRHWLRTSLLAGMGGEQRDGRRRDSLDAGCLPQCPWPYPIELGPDFVGEAGEGEKIEFVREHDALVPAVGGDVGVLPIKVDGVGGVGFETIRDGARQPCQLGPDRRELFERHLRIG